MSKEYVFQQNMEDPRLINEKILNFGLHEKLMVEVRLDILNEHVQHLFAICQQISLISGFRENDRLTARNPFDNRHIVTFKQVALISWLLG